MKSRLANRLKKEEGGLSSRESTPQLSTPTIAPAVLPSSTAKASHLNESTEVKPEVAEESSASAVNGHDVYSNWRETLTASFVNEESGPDPEVGIIIRCKVLC